MRAPLPKGRRQTQQPITSDCREERGDFFDALDVFWGSILANLKIAPISYLLDIYLRTNEHLGEFWFANSNRRPFVVRALCSFYGGIFQHGHSLPS